MFERFTDRARRVVILAQEEARMAHHDYIGTEHILLGLIHEGEGVAATALGKLGLKLDELRAQVTAILGPGRGVEPQGHIDFTPRAKTVLNYSLREALQLGHNYIGTEHILLGLVREGEGIAAQVLVKNGAELTKVRITVIELISGYQGKKEPLAVATQIGAGGGGAAAAWVPTSVSERVAAEVISAMRADYLPRLQAALRDKKVQTTRGEGYLTDFGAHALATELIEVMFPSTPPTPKEPPDDPVAQAQ